MTLGEGKPHGIRTFREAIERPSDEIDLAEAALLIAQSARPELKVAEYLIRIDVLGEEARERAFGAVSDGDRILALNRYLFEEQGFAPNVENYYDVRNSFLDQVLDRRVGIPITLSILYMEVGRRIGLPLQGVSFPGHFLVKCKLPEGTIVLDPYAGGASLSLQDLQQRLRQASGGEVSRAIVAGKLGAASNKEILARVLRNLQAIYTQQGEADRALAMMEWIIALAPSDPAVVRDRGLLYAKLECFRAAVSDLEHYLERVPDAHDRDDIRARVVELRQASARLN